MRLRILAFVMCLCLAAPAQAADPNTELRQLTKQAKALAAAGKTEDAILLLQKNLATIAARQPGRNTLADALELLGTLATDRAQDVRDPVEARRLYSVSGSLLARALALREEHPQSHDAAIGRLYYEMQQAASRMNELPAPAAEDSAAPSSSEPAGGIGSLGKGATGPPPKVEIHLAADASGGATFCVLRCDPAAPAASSAMDPADVRSYNAAFARLERDAGIRGGIDRESGRRIVQARKQREAAAAAYAAGKGEPAYSGAQGNSLTVATPACDAAGCHQDMFADVVAAHPEAESGGGGGSGHVVTHRLRSGKKSSGSEVDKSNDRPETDAARLQAEQRAALEKARAEEEYRRAEERARAEQELRQAEAEAASRQGAASSQPAPSSAAPTETYDAARPDVWNAPPANAPRLEKPEPGTGGGSSGGVVYSKKQTIDFSDVTVEGDLTKPTAADLASIERFPTLESPDQVDAGVEFAVQVSLTTEQVTPEAKITGGKQTAEGKLAMALPAQQDQWTIDVVLSTTGLDVIGGANVGHLTLPREGDSTVAMFRLRARPQAGTGRVMATLWHAGAYLGKVTRVVSIGPAATVSASGAASARTASTASAAKTAPAAPAAETTNLAAVPATKPQRALAAVDMNHQAPDLTVYIVQAGPDSSDVLIDSPYLQPTHYHVPRNEKLGPWLRTEYAELVRRGNVGNSKPARTEAAFFLQGFGRQVYEQFAPAPFKAAFWKLADKLGPKFRTIQIFTDDPALPWELMRPVRDDGTGERDFLGAEFAVARWHITEDTRQYDSPPQREPVRAIAVIAPRYEGESALAAQSSEVGALAKLSGYEAVPGSLESVRGLLQQLPQGIVHFAGHGRAQRKDAGVQYAIQLEDGVLDLMTWRGLVESGQPNHPVFFMNACEIGSANQVGNFVDGWAPEVLRTGASGYIGALWAVDDKVASEFARRFYADYEKELKADAQVDVSELLARTRREVYAQTGSPTALAYVFYGDANLKLVGK